MSVTPREIKNRERRESRIAGCTWTEWVLLAAPALGVSMFSPWLFTMGFIALWATVVIGVGRRMEPGALQGMTRHHVALLRYGTRATRIVQGDPWLRAGAPFLVAPAAHSRRAGLVFLLFVGAAVAVGYVCFFM